jgi:hypothetical protein
MVVVEDTITMDLGEAQCEIGTGLESGSTAGFGVSSAEPLGCGSTGRERIWGSYTTRQNHWTFCNISRLLLAYGRLLRYRISLWLWHRTNSAVQKLNGVSTM